MEEVTGTLSPRDGQEPGRPGAWQVGGERADLDTPWGGEIEVAWGGRQQ